ncbi:hypothetical protein [Micromonospora sp. NPDC047527]|uniref:hypothetical protein n=1 Tax=Micromonospora sp. NPDC047527 TaxID=3155144 RepID=UPI0033DDB79A
MDQPVVPAIIPAVMALVGLIAGLLAPMITGSGESRRRRREDQRARCDEILGLFVDVNVSRALTEPESAVRRRLVLSAARLKDRSAREACLSLANAVARSDVDEDEVLRQWTFMIQEVSRVYRSHL